MAATPTTSTTPTRRHASRGALVATLALAVCLLSSCLSPGQAEVRDSMNADRTALHLKALPTQADAQRKAQAWAEKLARENKLYHSNLLDGIKVKWCSIGENVGYGRSATLVEEAYMKSPGHKANIVNPNWNGVGAGYATNGDRVFTVQVFIKTC